MLGRRARQGHERLAEALRAGGRPNPPSRPSKVDFCVNQPEGGSSTAGSSVNSSCARPTPRSA